MNQIEAADNVRTTIIASLNESGLPPIAGHLILTEVLQMVDALMQEQAENQQKQEGSDEK